MPLFLSVLAPYSGICLYVNSAPPSANHSLSTQDINHASAAQVVTHTISISKDIPPAPPPSIQKDVKHPSYVFVFQMTTVSAIPNPNHSTPPRASLSSACQLLLATDCHCKLSCASSQSTAVTAQVLYSNNEILRSASD